MIIIHLFSNFFHARDPASMPPKHPPTSDHLALTSALIVNEISLSLCKFLQLILLRLLPLLIVSTLNNLLNIPFFPRENQEFLPTSHTLFSVYPPPPLSSYLNIPRCVIVCRRGEGGGRGAGLGQHLPKALQPRSISGLKFI